MVSQDMPRILKAGPCIPTNQIVGGGTSLPELLGFVSGNPERGNTLETPREKHLRTQMAYLGLVVLARGKS